ncbi:MAG: asparagine synthase (glutamine-hydrolyzing) [Flavobacteriales bacterium]|nr:asparagine synthase (glutamine-hydrolyzing) [Flavobacteriales bacterium]
MCGINGVFGLEHISGPEIIMERMNQRTAHRGPDAAGIRLFDNVVLGHRRLAIIDLSSDADQPMNTPDGRYCLVFNGEIYNFQEIRSELVSYDFRTDSDSEVLLAAYATWGPACLQKLNGMFSMAIWDDQEKTLFIARDRMGIKPLYYSFQDTSLVFSSEIKGLLASELVSPRLNHKVLDEYLAYQTVHDPNTLLEGVHMLPAGHYMMVNDSEHHVRQYWDCLESPLRKEFSGEVHTEIEKRLYDSVERRMISDVPIGAFLSGGIDSSIMVGIMSRMTETQISSFSVVFDEQEFSEAPYARMIADRFHTAHHEIELSPDDFLSLLPDSLQAMDHPSGDGPNTYVVSKVTKEAGLTVAISGLGGDELFAGYPHFLHAHNALSRPWIAQYPMVMRKLLASIVKQFKTGISGAKASRILTSLRMELEYIYPIMRESLLRDERQGLLNSTSKENPLAHKLSNFSDRWKQLPILSQISIAELETYLRSVLLRDTDQMSMAHALEVRVPFLDHELVEYVLRVDDESKYPHSPKRLLLDSVPGLLPDEVIHRPKMGFTLPWEQWLKADLREFAQRMIDHLDERRIFRPNAVRDLWKRFLKGDARVTWARVWPLIVLENWIEIYGVET